ncbi:MAG: lysophospholipid acyltransferase family protein [Acidimicrobiales bacterium]
MRDGWRHPGRIGGLVYAVAALLLGGVVAVFSRLRLAEERGRRRAARALPEGAIIIVSNHASYADGVLLALICRRMGRSVRLLATSGVFRIPVLGSLARSVGFIPVARGSASAADALEPAAAALAVGEAVGIFPEGRTTRDPDHWPERAKTGAVRLALRTGAPIVPVAMVGTHRVLSRRSPLRSILVNVVLRPEVLTEVGEPIDVAELARATGHRPDDVRGITDEVWTRVVALVAGLRADAAPDPRGTAPATD